MKLDEIMKGDVVVVFRQGGDGLSRKGPVLRPPAEIHRAMLVAQKTERRVRHEPMGVPGKKLFVFPAAKRGGFLRRKNLPQKFQLQLYDRLVVHGFQGVQPLALRLQRLEPLLIFHIRGGGKVQVKRMQRERGNRRVGIRVLPGAGGAGVVDGQQLNQFQPRFFAPVCEPLEVEKFPDTKPVFAAQTENRHGHPRSVPGVCRKVGEAVIDNAVRTGGGSQHAVRTILKAHERVVRHVKYAVFVAKRKGLVPQVQ